jgi:hypothetical protein
MRTDAGSDRASPVHPGKQVLRSAGQTVGVEQVGVVAEDRVLDLEGSVIGDRAQCASLWRGQPRRVGGRCSVAEDQLKDRCGDGHRDHRVRSNQLADQRVARSSAGTSTAAPYAWESRDQSISSSPASNVMPSSSISRAMRREAAWSLSRRFTLAPAATRRRGTPTAHDAAQPRRSHRRSAPARCSAAHRPSRRRDAARCAARRARRRADRGRRCSVPLRLRGRPEPGEELRGELLEFVGDRLDGRTAGDEPGARCLCAFGDLRDALAACCRSGKPEAKPIGYAFREVQGRPVGKTDRRAEGATATADAPWTGRARAACRQSASCPTQVSA